MNRMDPRLAKRRFLYLNSLGQRLDAYGMNLLNFAHAAGVSQPCQLDIINKLCDITETLQTKIEECRPTFSLIRLH